MVTVYDANQWVRRQLEGGRTVRQCVDDIRFAPAPVLAVWDGPRSLERRRSVYPQYKAKRPQLTEDMTASFELMRQCLMHTHVIQMRVLGYEADDVIAQIAKTEKISLWSTDKDFLALPNVTFMEQPKVPCNPSLIRLYKTLVGDPSDNIPGLKGFGPKSFAALDPWDVAQLTLMFTQFSKPKMKDLQLRHRIEENADQLRIFWEIIGFYPVSEADLEAGTSMGRPNEAVLNNIYAKYLL